MHIAYILFESYVQVVSFVALTLLLFYYLDDRFSFALRLQGAYRSTQIVTSACLGAIPGCGGAIAVVTQFSVGNMCFASMVAGLTATMGDAAFLLFATEPLTALWVTAGCILTGCLLGMLVKNTHEKDYLVPSSKQSVACSHSKLAWRPWIRYVWLALLVMNIPATVLTAMQRSAYTWWWQDDGLWLGVISVGFILLLHATRHYGRDVFFVNASADILDKTMHTTHFVTVWVVGGYLVFDTILDTFGWDVAAAFEGVGVWTPLLAALVGLIPSCGPQVVLTGLYLKGFLPFSALMANALSSDGDALFPAFAVSPRAAFVATVYGMVPALLIGYALYFVWGM